MKIVKKCRHCGVEFSASRKDKLTCSEKCNEQFKRGHKHRICQACGKEYIGYRTTKYCSKRCYLDINRKHRSSIKMTCEHCNSSFIGRLDRVKRHHFCSRGCFILWQKGERNGVKRKKPKISTKLRFDILSRDGFKCVYCGMGAKDGVTLEIDHVIPIALGGRDVKDNLVTACSDCNAGKSNRKIDFKHIFTKNKPKNEDEVRQISLLAPILH